jgi:GTP-binding protein EngB required for normal cell division
MSETPLHKLIEWYRKHVKPFFLDHGLEKVEEYDAEVKRLERIQATLQAKLPVCFLGNAGIGKSTLINAVVFGKDIYIPSGGVGPLTAQALTVCYGEHASFEVLYHTTERYNQVVFGLHQSYTAKLKREAGKGESATASPEELGLELNGQEEKSELEAIAKDAGEEQARKLEDLRKQACLMVAGRQDAQREIPYLIDALLAASGKPMRHGTTLLNEDGTRIERLRAAIQLGKSKQPQTHREGDSPEARAEFLKLLHDHATGFLAPLIKDLTVRWNESLLRDGLTLVDLPGVGIAGDVKAGITENYIREQAKAVVLVVSSRGVQQTEAELLRSSGFLNRLLHSSDDPSADPVSLMVVVTRIDDIAEEHFAQDRTRKKPEHFAEACAQVQQMIKQQLRSELEKVWRSVAGLSDEKKGVIDDILDNLQVHPVSALQYRRFLAQDQDDPWFIRDASQSNMPQLIEALRNLARQRSEKQRGHLEAEADRFFRRVRARLQVIRTQWENQLHAADEAEQLRASLEAFIEEQKLRSRFSNRQGAYREFLKSTLPTLISKNVTEASVKAREEIYAYMQDMQFYPWNTLRAAVTRRGTFAGSRHIDLPKDFALRFEEPIAEKWGRTILKEIRVRTNEYANDACDLVKEIHNWAKQQGAKVRTKLLEAEIEVIKEDAERLKVVGKEAVDELRKEVQAKLLKRIEGPIRRKCEKFVEEGEHIGPGVKMRILQLFRRLANETIEAATDPAIDLLTEKFREVEHEIVTVFKEHKEHTDPIQAAVDALVASHEQRIEREDRKKKEAVLQGLEGIEAVSPLPWDEPKEAAVSA